MTFRLLVRTVRGANGETGAAVSGDAAEHAFDLDRDVILVGRRSGVDVPLPHPDVAGVHVRFVRNDKTVILCNQQASTETVLNGETLARGEERVLGDQDVIGIAGAFELTYVASSPAGAQPTSEAGTGELARAMVRDVIAALGASTPEADPTLVVEKGPRRGHRYDLPPPGHEVIVGRGESCDLVIVDADISREQLRIKRDLAGALVAELGSKNGTFVAGERLLPGSERRLRHDERIHLGGTVLRFCDPSEEYLASWTLPEDEPAAPAQGASEAEPREAAQNPEAAAPLAADSEPTDSEPPRVWLTYAIAGAVIFACVVALFLLLRS